MTTYYDYVRGGFFAIVKIIVVIATVVIFLGRVIQTFLFLPLAVLGFVTRWRVTKEQYEDKFPPDDYSGYR